MAVALGGLIGVYTILDHIQQARAAGFGHLYLGYWIEASRKMAYKGDYRPLEAFQGNHWERLPYSP